MLNHTKSRLRKASAGVVTATLAGGLILMSAPAPLAYANTYDSAMCAAKSSFYVSPYNYFKDGFNPIIIKSMIAQGKLMANGDDATTITFIPRDSSGAAITGPGAAGAITASAVGSPGPQIYSPFAWDSTNMVWRATVKATYAGTYTYKLKANGGVAGGPTCSNAGSYTNIPLATGNNSVFGTPQTDSATFNTPSINTGRAIILTNGLNTDAARPGDVLSISTTQYVDGMRFYLGDLGYNAAVSANPLQWKRNGVNFAPSGNYTVTEADRGATFTRAFTVALEGSTTEMDTLGLTIEATAPQTQVVPSFPIMVSDPLLKNKTYDLKIVDSFGTLVGQALDRVVSSSGVSGTMFTPSYYTDSAAKVYPAFYKVTMTWDDGTIVNRTILWSSFVKNSATATRENWSSTVPNFTAGDFGGFAAISGTPQVRQTLSASVSLPANSKVKAYRWYRSGRTIGSANKSTYRAAQADYNKTISSQVDITLSNGTKKVLKSSTGLVAPAPMTVTSKPKITGVIRLGSTVRINKGHWSPTPTKFSYRWMLDGVAVSGATKSSFKIPSTARGKKISIEVTGTKLGYAATPVVSVEKQLAGSPLTVKTTPKMSGTLKANYTVKVSNGSWTPSATKYTYKWMLDGVVVAGATKSYFKLPVDSKGKIVSAQVTAGKSGYESVAVNSSGKLIG